MSNPTQAPSHHPGERTARNDVDVELRWCQRTLTSFRGLPRPLCCCKKRLSPKEKLYCDGAETRLFAAYFSGAVDDGPRAYGGAMLMAKLMLPV